MARNDLLSVFGLESLKEILVSPPNPPLRHLEKGVEDRALVFAKKLGEQVLEKFLQQEDFLKAEPILLGSWARDELTPESDLDLLFLGPEQAVFAVVQWAQKQGIKIRSRLPENPDDLCQGVELWDQLSLLDGRALTKSAEARLFREQKKILGVSRATKKKWISLLKKERLARFSRYDSIQNLLEPNIKYGLGGLRDLQQARIVEKLFPEITNELEHARKVFDFYSKIFLWIRILIHLEGAGDLMNGTVQPAVAQKLGFADYREFMGFVQKGLSRVSFYSDWLFERGVLAKPKSSRLQKASDLTKILLQDPSVIHQFEVRQKLDFFWSEKSLSKRSHERGKEILKFFSRSVTEKHWIALFRSRLMDRLLPQLRPLIGYVQHDQYHRYTADAHILQVIREVLRARKSQRHLGALGAFAKNFKTKDWQILLWTAIYHDLAKGRPEDHSDLGAEWVKKDLKSFGVPAVQIKEVQWLVQHHLAFSQAAFRRNSQDFQILNELSELNLTESRIRQLLIFTAIDILGTNAESWNEWKEKLLVDLGKRLLSPESQAQAQLLKSLKDFGSENQSRLLEIAEEIGVLKLKKDLEKVQHKSSISREFFQHKKRSWVRFHHPQDESGTLAKMLGQLFQAGASVLQASVMTLPEVGIYDWFCLDFSGRPEALEKRLSLLSQTPASAPNVKWESVQIVQKNEKTWTLLFKGMDQRGLLWNAAQKIFEAGLQIESAQVQTWGQKAEDLFVVKAPATDSEQWLKEFRQLIGIN